MVKFKEIAEKEKVDTKAFLNLDICTRLNSIYLMLKAAITYEKVFLRYLEEDACFAIERRAQGILMKQIGRTQGRWLNSLVVFMNSRNVFVVV